MKNLILKSLILASLTLFISFAAVAAPVDGGTEKCERLDNAKRDVNITLISKEGCKFHIKGDVSLWSMSFTGTVSASGEPPCPNDTWTFGIANPGGGGNIEISGDNEIVSILSEDPDLVIQLAVEIGLLE